MRCRYRMVMSSSNEDLKINYRGIDLERCSEALQPGRIFGRSVGASGQSGAASAMKMRRAAGEIDLRKAACEMTCNLARRISHREHYSRTSGRCRAAWAKPLAARRQSRRRQDSHDGPRSRS